LRQLFLALLIGVTLSLDAIAGGVPVAFQLDPLRSFLQVELSATAGPITVSDSGLSPVSGTIGAVLDFSGSLDPPPTAGINFTGGRQFLDKSLDLSLVVFLLLDVDVQMVDLSSIIRTRVPQGLLSRTHSNTYEFDAAEHIIIQDQGTFSANGTAVGEPISETMDFSQTPLVGTADPNTIGSLVVIETGAISTGKFYQAELNFSIDFVEELPVEGFPGLVTVDVSGSLVGVADFAVPVGFPGDFDDDSDVDGADFLLQQRSFGDVVPPGTSSDDNLDGMVSAADLGIWGINFGQVSAGADQLEGLGLSVPEPATLLIACSVVAVLVAVRRGLVELFACSVRKTREKWIHLLY